MRFAKPIHWAEGLFLEPQHLQRSQVLTQQQTWQTLSLCLPYAYGLIDLEIDEEALEAKRIVLTKLSAIMPDGTEISMPGNCRVPPLQLDLNPPVANAQMSTNPAWQAGSSGLMVYLSLPSLSVTDSNLGVKNKSGRYSLAAESMLDENTGDNEVSLIVREYNVQLTTKDQATTSHCVLPICRIRYSSQLKLQLDKTYLPPFVTVSDSCPLLPWATELLFMLKNCRVNLEADIEKDGFDSKLVTGADMLRLTQLAALNSFIERAENFLQPQKITPFALALELCDLLGRLSVLNPLAHARSPLYQHEDAFPMFQELSLRIRTLLSRGNTSQEFACLEFGLDQQGFLGLFNLPDTFFSAGQYFLAVSFECELKERIADVENGDNFRLLDVESFKDRVRGVKLMHLRYPPHFLPSLNHTLWFRLMIEDSLKVWDYIREDRAMVIDYAPSLFVSLRASLYFSVEQSASTTQPQPLQLPQPPQR